MINLESWNENGRAALKEILNESESFEAFEKKIRKIDNIDAFLDHARDFLLMSDARYTYSDVLIDQSKGTYNSENIRQLAKNFIDHFELLLEAVNVKVKDRKGIGTCFDKFFEKFLGKTYPNINWKVDGKEQFFTSNEPDETTEYQNYPETKTNKDLFPFFYELKIIFDLRNLFDHTNKIYIIKYATAVKYPEYPQGAFLDTQKKNKHFELQSTCLLAYLALIAYAYPEVKEYLAKHNEPDYTEHLLNIKTDFEQYVKKYIVKGTMDNIIPLKLVHAEPAYNKNLQQQTNFKITGNLDVGRNIQETLQAYKRFMLTGNAGVGKTTTLKYTAYQLAKAILDQKPHDTLKKDIPIFIELGKNIPDLTQHIANLLHSTLQQVKSLMERGRLVVILDAINEVNKEYADNTKQDIKQLWEQNSNLKVIISGRPNDHKDLKPIFRFKEVEDHQIKAFLMRNANTPTQKTLLNNIFSNNAIINLLRNSAFLIAEYTIEIMEVEDGDTNPQLPKNKHEIVALYLRKIIAREMDKTAFIRDKLPIFKTILGILANMEIENDAYALHEEIENAIKEQKGDTISADNLADTLKLATQMGFLEKKTTIEQLKEEYKFTNPDIRGFFRQNS